MGKWDKLVGVLPRYNGNDPGYQDVVDRMKERILKAPMPNPFDTDFAVNRIDQELVVIGNAMDRIVQYLVGARGGKRYASLFAASFRDARQVKEALEEHVKTANLLLEAYNQLLVDQFEVEGSTSLKLEDGASVRMQYEPYATVKDPAAFLIWCRENGYANKLTLPWATTNALVKERLEEGEAEPDGISVYTKTKLVLTKGKE